MDTVTRLDTVYLPSKAITAEDKLAEKKEIYRLIYLWGDVKNMVGFQNGLSLNLNKLYNLFSRRGKQSRKLQHDFEQDYQTDLIQEQWFPLTSKYTDLPPDSLLIFRKYFQPSLKWIKKSDTYDRIAYIQKCLRNYRDSADWIHRQYRLPDIQPSKP